MSDAERLTALLDKLDAEYGKRCDDCGRMHRTLQAYARGMLESLSPHINWNPVYRQALEDQVRALLTALEAQHEA